MDDERNVDEHNTISHPKFDFNLDELSEDNSQVDAMTDTLRNASSIASVTQAGLQTASLQSAIDNFARELEQSAIAHSTGLPLKTPSAQYKGFAAEEYFKQTLKINALAQGVPDYELGVYTSGELPDGTVLSGIDRETDISIWTRRHPWNPPTRTVDYQSKIHNDAAAYAKDISNAQYENVEFVGGSGQGVNDTISVNAGSKRISSDSITPEEATTLSDSMKRQRVSEYQQGSEKHVELDRINLGKAVAVGAATGAVLSLTKEIVQVIKNRDNLSEDQFVKSIESVLCGSVEGAVRGGAIMKSVQMIAGISRQRITANSLGAIPVMAVANTVVDFAKDLYKCFITQTIDADDLLCNTVNNSYTSLAGFGGAYFGGQVATFASAKASAATGAAIGSPLGPIGTIVGAVVGSIVIGLGANVIIGTANKDAHKAFFDCVTEINTHTELGGCKKLYYFADAMSSISDFRLSFKNLLPCYNLISDLKEYNLRKKAIKSIHEQLDAGIASIETAKKEALYIIEDQHNHKISELTNRFREQRNAMREEFFASTNIYVSNSYAEYLGAADVLSGDIESILSQLDNNIASHNTILEGIRNRNSVNRQLNEMLSEIMQTRDIDLLRPFIRKLSKFMQQDELLIGKQYLSFDEALHLIGGLNK